MPVMPIATPMFACFSAGASFTPSPVIATTWPFACSARTRPQLVLGGDAGEDVVVLHDLAHGGRRPSRRAATPVTASAAVLGDAQLLANRLRRCLGGRR